MATAYIVDAVRSAGGKRGGKLAGVHPVDLGATVLDALEPGPTAQLSRGTFASLDLKAGDMVRVTTRRGTVDLTPRQDDAVPDGVVFIPFAYVEAAANLLTNPALDPFGKIPEFKYCAAKVEKAPAMPTLVAAE